jgi:hypothetical protein
MRKFRDPKVYLAQPFVMRFDDGCPITAMDTELVRSLFFTHEHQAAAWMTDRGAVYNGHFNDDGEYVGLDLMMTSWEIPKAEGDTHRTCYWLVPQGYRRHVGWAIMERREAL